MVARFSVCQRQQLELAVADRLEGGAAEQLSRHLQSCPHCQHELEELAGSSQWWDDARTFLSSTDDVVAIDDTTDADHDHVLDFLEPADDPALLGRLGGYQIEEVVGRGGMGIVLKAKDPALDRTVAIKLLATPLAASAAARKRFAREAKAAAAVVHDHVIAIYSVDTAGTMPFLVMPFIAGRALQDRLDSAGPLETKEILRIAIQTARGLAAAHAQGLVHRDIKPANILLENGVERVRISDFGLARTIDDASQSQSGYIAGTPQYMAPEQARGEPIDARADLFSLGSVIYAMCSGHPPFRAETTLAVLRRICDDAPRDLREANPDVPEWLAAIVARLLAKSPDERFQSADEVADLLERWLAHLQQPTVIAPPQSSPAARKPTPRSPVSRRWMIGGSSAAAVAALALAGAVWQSGLFAPPSPKGESERTALHTAPPPQFAPISGAMVVVDPLPAVDDELRRAWQETVFLEAAIAAGSPGGVPIEQEIGGLQKRLDALEWELTPRKAQPQPSPPKPPRPKSPQLSESNATSPKPVLKRSPP
jgi:serine/threonine-protein kinase